jgi:hypothetical protein
VSERARILREMRQGIEDFSAFAATHLTAGRAQHFRG